MRKDFWVSGAAYIRYKRFIHINLFHLYSSLQRNYYLHFIVRKLAEGQIFLLEVTHPLRSHFTGVRMVYIENVVVYAASYQM